VAERGDPLAKTAQNIQKKRTASGLDDLTINQLRLPIALIERRRMRRVVREEEARAAGARSLGQAL